MTVKRENPQGEVFLADEAAAGTRLDAFIASGLPDHVSRSRVKDVIKKGGVWVNGLACDSPNYRMKTGDSVSIEIPEPEDAQPKPEQIPLDIYFEDSHLLVINKPPGMVVHPAVGNWNGTLVNALLAHCGDTLSGIGGVRRPGIVHRLDKDTSGLMVVAKTEAAHSGLSAQFKDHGKTGALQRVYLALVWGQISPTSGTVETWLGRSPSNRKKRAVVSERHPDAKHAVTHYQLERTYREPDNNGTALSLVTCRLETGRTHQIRVHMSHIGHPLVGDPDYGKHFATKLQTLGKSIQVLIKAFRRQALHAAVLGFAHPVSGDVLHFEAPPPDDLQILLRSLGLADNGL